MPVNSKSNLLHTNPLTTLLLACVICLTLIPNDVQAQWIINPNIKDELGKETIVAYVINDEGYSLEIYKDSVSAIRGRFSIGDRILGFQHQNCPTYQIDRGTPSNTSVSGAPCLSTDNWAEFIVGYIRYDQVISSPLLAIMNGINITFRFRLENGDYREAKFSLRGSKRILTAVIGNEITVLGQ